MSENDSAARLVGINHVALPVGDVEAATEFYGSVFEFEVRGRSDAGVFLDMGDQFLALMETAADANGDGTIDDHRHVGRALDEHGVETLDTSGLDFRDPWGNRLQVVAYEEVQFTKADHVRDGMRLSDLEKSATALAELVAKGMAPEE